MEALIYLFSPIPGSAFKYSTAVMIFAVALIVIAIALIILIKIKNNNKALRKVYRNTPGHFIWMGISLIVLTASRTNAIPYLSMRFLLYIILLISVYLVGLNIYRLFTKYPEMKNVTKPKPKKEDNKKSYSTSKKK